MSKLVAIPINLSEANNFVDNFHRHNKPVVGAKFSIGCSDGERLVGVAIVGRPIARNNDNGVTAEVTRCCVIDDAPKGSCSFLYASCWRAWKAMGGQKIITYTLQSEGGASLRGSGWTILHEVKIHPNKRWTNRPGREWQSVSGQQKFCWGVSV
jgi:hypothetical protein